MEALKHEAFQLGWTNSHGIVNNLDVKLQHARNHLAQGRTKQAQNVLQAFRHELDAQRGQHVSEDAYQLLSGNADFLVSQIGP
ncbi:MAG: hypothetical protein AB1758_04415 [Candidatus Eremiobacterota bacterium]